MIWPRRRRPASNRPRNRARRPQVLDRAPERLEPRVVPAVVTWTGAGGSNLWSDAANWADNDSPDPGDDLVFPATSTRISLIDDFADLSVNSISVDGPYDLRGAAGVRLTLAPGGTRPTGITVAGAANQAVRLAVPELRIGGDSTLSVPTSLVLFLNSSAGVLSGPGSLRISGGGGVELGGTQSGSYTGAITVSQGFLRQGGPNVFRSLTIGRDAYFGVDRFDVEVATLAGDGANITLGTGRLIITGDSSTVGFGGSIIGDGGITIREGASLALLSVGFGYQGETTVRGSLTMGRAGGSRVSLLGSRVNLVADGATTGRLAVVAGSEALVGSLVGGGSVAGPGGTPGLPAGSSLRVGLDGRDAVFTGQIVGEGDVTKYGNGSWALTSDGPETWTGTLNLLQGSLAVDGDSYRNTAVVVSNGDLAGTRLGSFRGGDGAGDGGQVSPGLFGVGVMNVGGTVEFGSMGLSLDLAGPNPGQYDRLVAPNATVSLGALVPTIRLRNGYTPAPGTKFTVIEADRISSISGVRVDSDGYGYLMENTGKALTLTVVRVPSRTTLSVSNPTPALGDTITLTATVTPVVGSEVATGTVTFGREYGTLGEAPLVNGVASIRVSPSLGRFYVNAFYNGATTLSTSFAERVFVVAPARTGVVLTSSGNPSAFGRPVTFTIAVTPSSLGGSVPRGYVGLVFNGTERDAAQLVDGVATYTRTDFGVGTIRVEANYFGDDYVFAASTVPAVLDQVVTRAPVDIRVAADPNPAALGRAVTLRATVVPDPFGRLPRATGRVRFRVGATVLGVADLDAGAAAITTDLLPAGRPEIVADYLGDDLYQAGTSAPAVQVVNPGAVVASVVAGPTSTRLGEPVTLVASARPVAPASAPLSGRFVFRVGTTVLGSAPVADGLARLTTTALPVGSDPIAAEYVDDPSYATATATTGAAPVVAPGVTTVALSSTRPQAASGEAVTFVATVAASVPGAGVPAGSVVFAAGSVVLGSAPIVEGVARLTTATLPEGVSPITATYSGDANFAPAASATLPQVVSAAPLPPPVPPAPPALAGLVASTATAASGQVVTFVATARSASPGGFVLFVDGTQLIGVAELVDGRASLAVPISGAGWTHTILAQVLGGTSDPVRTTVAVVRAETRADVAVAPVRNRAGRLTGFSVTGTVAVAAPGGGTPTGIVTILVNGRAARTVALVNGRATQVVRLADALNRRVRVRYEGDADRSGSLSQTVVARRPAPARPGKIRDASKG